MKPVLLASIGVFMIALPALAQTPVTGTITITANAFDEAGGSGMDRVEFYVDGNLVGTDSDTADADFSIEWDSASMPNGTYPIMAVAFDVAGNSASASVSIASTNADVTAPTVTIQIVNP